MADSNKSAIEYSQRLVEREGLVFQGACLIGSNYMSLAAPLQSEKVFAVHAKLGPLGEKQGLYYTFTYKFRHRKLRNRTTFNDPEQARRHYDMIIDTGNIMHANNIDVLWYSMTQYKGADERRITRINRGFAS